MTTALRIDFVALRAELKIAEVLRLLDCEMSSQRGSQWRGACPLHGVALGTARCFSVNVERQCFYCFKCGRSGNALDLWCAATNQTPYDAALDLCRRLNVPVPYMKYGELHTSVHLRSRRQHREIGYRVLKNVDFQDPITQKKNHASLCVVYGYASGWHGTRTRNRLPGITFPVSQETAENTEEHENSGKCEAPGTARSVRDDARTQTSETSDARLQRIIDSWGQLPDEVQIGITRMIAAIVGDGAKE